MLNKHRELVLSKQIGDIESYFYPDLEKGAVFFYPNGYNSSRSEGTNQVITKIFYQLSLLNIPIEKFLMLISNGYFFDGDRTQNGFPRSFNDFLRYALLNLLRENRDLVLSRLSPLLEFLQDNLPGANFKLHESFSMSGNIIEIELEFSNETLAALTKDEIDLLRTFIPQLFDIPKNLRSIRKITKKDIRLTDTESSYSYNSISLSISSESLDRIKKIKK